MFENDFQGKNRLSSSFLIGDKCSFPNEKCRKLTPEITKVLEFSFFKNIMHCC